MIALISVGECLKGKRVRVVEGVGSVVVVVVVMVMVVALVKANKTRQMQQNNVHLKPSDAGDCDVEMLGA